MIRRHPESTRTDTLFPYTTLFRSPPARAQDGGWKDPKYWGLVNPNLGASVDEAFLADEMTKAEREGAANMALFASQHFNVEVGIGLRTDRWPGAEFWEQGEVPEFTLAELLDRSEAVSSEERRVGKECVSTCSSRLSPFHSQIKQNHSIPI